MSKVLSPLLLIGASVRAAAASAARGGFEVIALDRFGDADLRRLASVLPIVRWPRDVPQAVDALPPMPWMYCGSMENEPKLVARISRRHRLLGNGADVLKRVRDPIWVAETLASRGLPALRVHKGADIPVDGDWLLKPRRGGGGLGICNWVASAGIRRERPKASASYFQERRSGRSVSACFFAARRGIELIGISEQLIGPAEGASLEFGYAGSIGPLSVADQTQRLIQQIGSELGLRAELRGLFGVDFILDGDVPWTTEVNPRYTASVEIYERAGGRSLVAEHVRACESFVAIQSHSDVESPNAPIAGTRQIVAGKRIVYADADVSVPELEAATLGFADFLADIPPPGSDIAAGAPICTVFAEGGNSDAVRCELSCRAAAVQEVLIRRRG